MISLRVRKEGQEEWTNLWIDGDIEGQVLQIIGAGLDTSNLYVQIRREEGWEDLT